MSGYQHEIPSARVNITLDVETGGSNSKKELPMKLLMLGDYSHGQASGKIAERDKIEINKHNLNQVLKSLSPAASLTVPNRLNSHGGDLAVQLQFQALADFRPEGVVAQVPQLKRLKAMRNLLKDLKSCVVDNQSFRKALETIMKDTSQTERLLEELMKRSPVTAD